MVWSSASHYVLGVPYDVIQRARRQGGQSLEDMEDLVRINVNRMLYIMQVSGIWLLGLVAFFLSGLGTLAFWYQMEFAQAVLLIAAPMTLVGWMGLRLANRLAQQEPRGEALFKPLIRHRFWTQVVGMVSIFVTAMFGMFQNLVVALPGF